MPDNTFTVPPRWSRLAPCKERPCGHESCDRLRQIIASPCSICRKVIGYGVVILDERTPVQRDNDILRFGFTHYDCRRRWKARYTPQARKPSKPQPRARIVTPTPVHLDDDE